MTNDSLYVPRHIGFIPDGNRRWAKAHGLPTYEGHLAGYNATKEVLLACFEQGVRAASIYAFSTENWKRDASEVSRLMKLFFKALSADIDFFIQHNVRLRVIGTRDGLDEKLLKAIADAEEKTVAFTSGVCIICINYGGQTELADAVKKIVSRGIASDDITPELIEQSLYAPEVPPVDLIVRTSGEQRLSNFMTWQSAYSELMFIENKLWPEMTKTDVHDILKEYSRRNRRFGG